METEDGFPTTQWSLIAQAGGDGDARRRRALETLCRLYRRPVLKFMTRINGNKHDAEDWVQGFFADLLARDFTARLSPEHGRFRAFMLAAAGNYARKQQRKARTLKRGGVAEMISMEEVEWQVADQEHMPQALFDREWAWTMMENAMDQLQGEYQRAGKGGLFEALKAALPPGTGGESLRELAEKAGMSPGAIKVALHRLRKRWKSILCAEVARTVASEDEVEDEMRHLIQVLSRHAEAQGPEF